MVVAVVLGLAQLSGEVAERAGVIAGKCLAQDLADRGLASTVEQHACPGDHLHAG